ncbi:NHLP family bacteriocin export ABC transporter peptidase/permease/ATPase subunit [Anabaena sp. UHCC 0451]|uniref:NHLP family bacteriocin export ABC transporter peptidase/permease/ATPase subunit n=1 Tax=Anabaena sp. UHCC 0451 TaxID=2055235 RepID=UPI002B1EDCBC|nr:NHLP family bacteriocin export ABC transporter peptidase/permease/ATPase subunit [Anabaena sp. UHCC 0451]MEA5575507.1 NHLP family bacteriocin export ABC transporter peptidase/permease/ATPase subunit [Anabaena sp. UHCC 0451]
MVLINNLQNFWQLIKPTRNRVKTPTVLQMEATECGAAALGIILAYYQYIVPLAELRQECGISRDGSKAANIVKAARRYGMEAKGYKKGLESLEKVPVPYIVFWNFNHFLVVEGFSENWVYLNDPAIGRRKVSKQEFNEAYTGIVLVIEPGTNFKKSGEKRNTFLALHSRLKNSYAALLLSIFAGIILTLPRLALPAFAQFFTDEILIQGQKEWLSPLLLAMVTTTILQMLIGRLRLLYLRRLTIKLLIVMTGDFIWHILRLPINFYAQRFAGDISNRVNLNKNVVNILNRLSITIIDTLMLVFYAAMMFAYDRRLTIMTISFAGINLVSLQVIQRFRVDANLKVSQERDQLYGFATSGIQNIEMMKASGLESSLFAKFAGYYTKFHNAQQNLDLQSLYLQLLPNIFNYLANTTILVVGGLRVMAGSMSIGMLIAYQSLVISFLQPINSLVNFGANLQLLEADLERLDDIFNNAIDPELTREFVIKNDDTSPLFLQGQVELLNLTFGYNHLEAPLIENLNLIVKPGQRVALVGGSGSGKSTISKLITGLYNPWQGEILFDGIPRQQIPRLVLANSLAMVEQDIFLFAGTVRDNLTLWDETISDCDIIKACQDAEIHSLIMSLPGGYDAQLSEGGLNISGGQRQRLEIARALVRNPAILVLDEATSSLDAETELMIDRHLRRRGVSCIIIAHRLSTIRDCDEIIVLENGKVLQRGNHEELRLQPGIYSDLLNQ